MVELLQNSTTFPQRRVLEHFLDMGPISLPQPNDLTFRPPPPPSLLPQTQTSWLIQSCAFTTLLHHPTPSVKFAQGKQPCLIFSIIVSRIKTNQNKAKGSSTIKYHPPPPPNPIPKQENLGLEERALSYTIFLRLQSIQSQYQRLTCTKNVPQCQV